MEEFIHKTIALRRYLFSCPRVTTSSTAIFVLIIVFSLLGNKSFDSSEFFLFLLIPVAISSIGLRPLCRSLGGDLKTKHGFFLSLFALILLAVSLKITDVLASTSLSTTFAVIFTALNFLFLINLLVFSTMAGLRIYKAVVPSFLFPFLSLFNLSVFIPEARSDLMSLFPCFFVTYLIAWVFFFTMGLPLKKIRIHLFDLLTLAMVEHSGELRQPRNPFRNTGEKTEVFYQALFIEQEQGRHLMTIPWLHPGPLGTIGGNLPAELRNHLRQKFQNVIFLHTFVDHTLDPVFMNDVVRSIKELTDALLSSSTRIETATKVIPIYQDGVTVHGLRAGSVTVLFSSFAPDITEDISPEIGKNILSKFKDNVLLIDCHNSTGAEEKDMENVKPGDEKARSLIKAVETMRDRLASVKAFPIQAGIAGCEVDIPGVRHISAIVLRIDDQTSSFVVLDANNLYPGLRKIVCEKIRSIGIDHCEILTTDAHLGQEAMRMFGIGGTDNDNALIEKIIDQVKKAIEKIGPAKLRYGCGSFEAKVLGDFFEKLLYLSNKTRIQAKTAALLMSLAFILSSYFLIW